MQRREVIYRVYGISILSENKVTLYEDRNKQAAEDFALKFDGGDKEIFIEPVYRLLQSRHTDRELDYIKGREF